MDGRSLRRWRQARSADFIKTLDLAACALLVEVHGESKEALVDRCEQVMGMAAEFAQVASVPFTSDSAGLWAIRKGLFPAVGRCTTSTTVIIEDVAFPIERLAEGWRGCKPVRSLLNTVKPSSSATRWREPALRLYPGFDDRPRCSATAPSWTRW